MTVRIWDRGEFERSPVRMKRKKSVRHQLFCQAPGCTVVVTGKNPDKVAKALARHRKKIHRVEES